MRLPARIGACPSRRQRACGRHRRQNQHVARLAAVSASVEQRAITAVLFSWDMKDRMDQVKRGPEALH
jgi:hypothetical protein